MGKHRKQGGAGKLWRTAVVVLGNRKARRKGMAAGALFLLLYLFSLGHLFTGPPAWSLTVVDQPWDRMWMARAPFLWEPVAGLSVWRIRLFLSPLNLLMGAGLGVLVTLNMAVALDALKCRQHCSLRAGASAAGLLPAMLTGFACCAPTFLIAFFPVVASLSVFILSLQPFLIPLSLVMMVLGLVWSLRGLSAALPTGGRDDPE